MMEGVIGGLPATSCCVHMYNEFVSNAKTMERYFVQTKAIGSTT